MIHNGNKQLLLKVVFHPETEREDEFFAVSVSEAVFSNDVTIANDQTGTLIKYNLTKMDIIAVWDTTSISSSNLNIFSGGQRVLVVEGKKAYPAYRKVMILDADSLDLLHQVPLVPTANIGDITPIYSHTEHHLALITWKKFSGSTITKYKQVQSDCKHGEDEAKVNAPSFRRRRSSRHLCPVQVAIYKVSVDCATLLKLSSIVILRLTEPAKINRLPLPTSLLKMLLDVKRF